MTAGREACKAFGRLGRSKEGGRISGGFYGPLVQLIKTKCYVGFLIVGCQCVTWESESEEEERRR